MSALLCGSAKHAIDATGCAPPPRRFGVELGASARREAVEAGAAPGLGVAPSGGDPTAPEEALERGVDGTLLDGKDAAGQTLDAFGDTPAVHGSKAECLEDQQLERAGEEL